MWKLLNALGLCKRQADVASNSSRGTPSEFDRLVSETSRKYKLDELKSKLKDMNIKGYSNLKKQIICQMYVSLSNKRFAFSNQENNGLMEDPQDAQMNLNTLLLSIWHLRPIKNPNLQESLQKGLLNEPKVLKALPAFIKECGKYTDVDTNTRYSIEIAEDLWNPGLIAKVYNHHVCRLLCGSIDFVGLVEITSEHLDGGGKQKFLFPFAGESKMKTSSNSQLQESIYMHRHGINEFEYIKVDIQSHNDSWKRFCLLVNDPEHRVQLGVFLMILTTLNCKAKGSIGKQWKRCMPSKWNWKPSVVSVEKIRLK